jgi:hypothetical protein
VRNAVAHRARAEHTYRLDLTHRFATLPNPQNR